MHLSWIDIAIVLVYVGGTILAGTVARGAIRNISEYMYITGTIYLAGAVGTVALGLYWKRANTAGAYCALILGAIAPINFLIMSQVPEHVPDGLQPLVESSNLSGLMSLILAGLGMVVGSLLTQKSHSPRPLDFSAME